MSKSPRGFHALMYHEICPSAVIPEENRRIDVFQRYEDRLPRSFFLDSEVFARQMRWLKDSGIRCLSLAEIKNHIVSGEPLPIKSVLLTFDDMYQSVRDHAYPILKELGLNAAGFVVADWLYPTRQPRTKEYSRTLSWPEIEEMSDVFEYANHSAALHTRNENGSAFQQATREQLIEDTRRAGSCVDHPDVYAFPFGMYTQQNLEWLAEAGVTLAFTTRPGYNSRRINPLEYCRFPILREMTDDGFRAIFDGLEEEQS